MKTKRPSFPPPNRNDPLSWDNWPDMAAEGILGSSPVFTPQSFRIRQHPKIYEVFSNLLNKKEVFANIDR
jgi:hypothetical protein